MDMTAYNLTVKNESNEAWDIFTFQKNPQPELNSPGLVSLAWFTKYTAAHSQAKFTWDLNYNFMWSDTGTLTPGVVFEASQSFPADPFAQGPSTATQAGNQVTLVYHPEQDYFEFTDGVALGAPSPGTLYVVSDASVPNGMASAGIGMSNAGTFALPGLTNITAEFTPQPAYWVAASVSMQQGQVLEDEVSNAVELQFTGVTSLTATFNPDHTWSVSPS
jgi:rhizosphere induced protein